MSLYDACQLQSTEARLNEAATFVPERIERIGQYTIERVLASNLVADVYLGLNASTGQQVAIKMLRAPALRGLVESPSTTGASPLKAFRESSSFDRIDIDERSNHGDRESSDALQPDDGEGAGWFSSQPSSSTAATRIVREWQFLKELNHPHIVKAIDAGEHNGIPYLVMEFLPGGDLHGVSSEKTRPSVESVLSWLIQTSSALQHIHDRGIIHRDLKPSNLLVKSPQEVCLGDFGIARADAAVGELYSSSSLTMPGSLLGTPDYMAPEQIECSTTVDARADLYSLGCVMYYLLWGRAPFAKHSGLSTKLAAHATEAIRFPGERLRCSREMQHRLEQLIRRLMAKSPADRPASANEVVDELKRIQLDAPGKSWLRPSTGKLIAAVAMVGITLVAVRGSELSSAAAQVQSFVGSLFERGKNSPVNGFSLSISVPDRQGPLTSDQPLQLTLESSRDCKVYVFRRGPQGSLDLLLPNAVDANNVLEAAQPRRVPGPDDAWELFLSAPYGEEDLVAVAVSNASSWTETEITQLMDRLRHSQPTLQLADVVDEITAQVDNSDVSFATVSIVTAEGGYEQSETHE
ncbi:MAG: protein kinase [Planctomycetales bacterium]|nr:protein kinase [Planctomycetales bacterium]